MICLLYARCRSKKVRLLRAANKKLTRELSLLRKELDATNQALKCAGERYLAERSSANKLRRDLEKAEATAMYGIGIHCRRDPRGQETYMAGITFDMRAAQMFMRMSDGPAFAIRQAADRFAHELQGKRSLDRGFGM